MARQLTPHGQELIDALAQKYSVGADTVTELLDALTRGNAASAQFNIPELGGRGQWMRGGMTQVGDMFNQTLRTKVDALCSELSGLLSRASASATAVATAQSQQSDGGEAAPAFGTMTSFFGSDASSSEWWPSTLGQPSTAGSQNSMRYAYFPETRRLALDNNGNITVHDTQDYQISGVSQQQSDRYSLVFTSQKGVVRVDDLPIVPNEGAAAIPSAAPRAPAPANSTPHEHASSIDAPASKPPSASSAPDPSRAPSGDDVIALIERLAQLRDKGILSEEEFAAKKTELLSRL